MTTITATTSPPSGFESAPAPTATTTDASISDAVLLSWALARAGFSNTLAIAGQATASHTALSPKEPTHFAIHVARPLPVRALMAAILRFRNRKFPPALLLLATSPTSTPYREHLHLNADSHVLGIRRHFRKAARAANRPRLLAVLWTTNSSLHAPRIRPWQSLRNLKRSGAHLATLDLSHIPLDTTADYFTGPRTHHKPVYHFFKRLFDIAFSLFALLVNLPICIPVALFIKLYDRGPIFFIHTREGRHAKPFGCIKFRTMVRDAEALKKKLREANQVDGPQFKIAHDPRITPIGRFLRKTNIDELPQFINVLRGEMSIVGPRPSPFEENQLCPGWREARLSVTPGITGLWQISRSRTRGAADFQEWIFYDTQYVDRRNFILDLRIVLLTLKELFGKGQ